MPILELQKRARELGRIRIGQQVEGTNKKGETYTRPAKLNTFRLTSASKPLLEKVAELYGGEVQAWTPKGGSPQWEVITTSARIPILVPPQPVTQWLETWSAAGCIHRCDGVTNVLTDELCDPDDKAHQDARPTTRLNVVLRDVEGIGVWRLESHGWNAAIELPDAAQFLSQVDGYIDGHLALEQRTSIGENARTGKPETRHFMVPIIEINVTPAELMAGKGKFAPPSIEGPVQAPAIGSGAAAIGDGRPDYLAQANAATSTDEVNAIWKAANDAGHMTQELYDHLKRIGAGLQPAAEPETVDGQVELEPPDVLWQRCLTASGALGWTLSQLEDELGARYEGLTPGDATSEQLDDFLTHLEQEAA